MSSKRFPDWRPGEQRAKDTPPERLMRYVFKGVRKGMKPTTDDFGTVTRNIAYNAINQMIVLLSKDDYAAEALMELVEDARQHNKKG
jgi:hypothetical protein